MRELLLAINKWLFHSYHEKIPQKQNYLARKGIERVWSAMMQWHRFKTKIFEILKEFVKFSIDDNHVGFYELFIRYPIRGPNSLISVHYSIYGLTSDWRGKCWSLIGGKFVTSDWLRFTCVDVKKKYYISRISAILRDAYFLFKSTLYIFKMFFLHVRGQFQKSITGFSWRYLVTSFLTASFYFLTMKIPPNSLLKPSEEGLLKKIR